MSILAVLHAANAAPMVERSDLRRPALVLANAMLMLGSLVLVTFALTLEGEGRHIVLLGMAPAIASILIWPFMETFRLHLERGITGVTGLDAFIGSQILGAASAYTIHSVMHGANPGYLFQILAIPAMLWVARREIDRQRDAVGFPVELDDTAIA